MPSVICDLLAQVTCLLMVRLIARLLYVSLFPLLKCHLTSVRLPLHGRTALDEDYLHSAAGVCLELVTSINCCLHEPRLRSLCTSALPVKVSTSANR